MRSYDLVLLDADDTIFDFGRAEREALRQAFAGLGIPLGPEVEAGYLEINKELWRRLERGELDQARLRVERFGILFERFGIGAEPRAASEAYVARLSEAAFLLPGAEGLCAYLASRHRVAILTNGIAEVQRGRLARSAVAPCVERLVVSEEAGASKPDPRIFEYACEALGFRDKSRMIMVGDSLASDIKGGIDFGIDTCWVNLAGGANEAGLRPTYEVRRLDALRDIL